MFEAKSLKLVNVQMQIGNYFTVLIKEFTKNLLQIASKRPAGCDGDRIIMRK